MISKTKIEEHKEFYKKIQVPEYFIQNIIHINNAVNINEYKQEKSYKTPKVLYVGRNSPEKRIHLIIEIAKHFNATRPDVQFLFLGVNNNEIKATNNCKFLGNVSDEAIINNIYQEAHLLLITSSTEGFPMVVIEAMANKCAIIATDVGDIPLHIKNGINGYVINKKDENVIIKEAILAIDLLMNNHNALNTIGNNNFTYSKHHFNLEKFNFAYQQLFCI